MKKRMAGEDHKRDTEGEEDVNEFDNSQTINYIKKGLLKEKNDVKILVFNYLS